MERIAATIPYMDRFFEAHSTDSLPVGEFAAPVNETPTKPRRIFDKQLSPWRKRIAGVGAGLALTGALAACTPAGSSSSSSPESNSPSHSSSTPHPTASRTAERHGGKPIEYTNINNDNYAGFSMVLGSGRVQGVSGTITAPKATCPAEGAAVVNFVGISSSHVPNGPSYTEQEELDVLCGPKGGIPTYGVYAEMLPNGPVSMGFTNVSPRDEFDMSVIRTGDEFIFSAIDRATGQHKVRRFGCPTPGACVGNYADAISEVAHTENGNGLLPLPTLGPTEFDNIQVTTTEGGHHGLPSYGRNRKLRRYTADNGRELLSASTKDLASNRFTVTEP